jgi:hypothetical protein
MHNPPSTSNSHLILYPHKRIQLKFITIAWTHAFTQSTFMSTNQQPTESHAIVNTLTSEKRKAHVAVNTLTCPCSYAID